MHEPRRGSLVQLDAKEIGKVAMVANSFATSRYVPFGAVTIIHSTPAGVSCPGGEYRNELTQAVSACCTQAGPSGAWILPVRPSLSTENSTKKLPLAWQSGASTSGRDWTNRSAGAVDREVGVVWQPASASREPAIRNSG
jgi:hypothetical protein